MGSPVSVVLVGLSTAEFLSAPLLLHLDELPALSLFDSLFLGSLVSRSLYQVKKTMARMSAFAPEVSTYKHYHDWN
ncbi:hypothetical protein BDW74DRAFT_155807 [Aspergillus multicolor]|uniref:uncharacterized protein n=1 Tax=Aspergillus multicolor TaxID=41759 RepID=UPI003CCCDC07